eukprot:scaffold6625_cov117-Skeletonema_dohrnii-CCMP3373.AAC.3
MEKRYVNCCATTHLEEIGIPVPTYPTCDCLQAAPTHTYPLPDKIGWVWVFLCQYPPGRKSARVAPATYPPRVFSDGYLHNPGRKRQNFPPLNLVDFGKTSLHKFGCAGCRCRRVDRG